ncbi:hypothetical protein [Pedobacter gandavensis]|uniref:hypothetical protein n=1 Tax=Pedobacter gandavensis TaxID=2679963 RepID=UPI00292FB406|nr:hypothetical protein [Pedobacter gandavensis]
MKQAIDYIRWGVFFAFLGFFVCKVAIVIAKGILLTEKSPQVKAVIIDEKNFFVNSPSSGEFSYSYSFKIKDKVYEGNSMESKFKIGDTILVRYLKSNPSMNESVDYNDK